MKKIVFLSLFILCLPLTLQAQSIDDDLYYVPSKNKENVKQNKESKVEEIVIESNDSATSLTSSTVPVVVKDNQGNIRDIDEYNRRFNSKDHNFSFDNDTLYIEEKPYTGLDGEWVNGFDGSEDDYEYATRIIRFRNPRYAISVSSPLYWEVVYGLNSWDWNVYTDGLYAYVFPTFTNRLWWDWRFNYYGWWGYPYYGWGWGYPYYGWYGLGWSYSFYHHPIWHPGGWYPGGNRWAHNTFTNRRSSGGTLSSMGRTRSGSSTLSRSRGTTIQGGSSSSYRRSGQGGISTTRRVVGTRTSSERNTTSTHTGTINSTTTQQRGSYTRPSNTRVGSTSTLSTRNSSTVGNRRINTTTTQRTTRSTPTQRSGNYSARSTGSSRSVSTGGGSARSGGGGGGARRR